jgi:hypothetical protein
MEGEKKHEGTGVRSLMEGNKAMLLLAHRQLDGRCQVLGGETQVDIRDLLVVDLCSAGLNQFTAVGLARCEPQLHVQLHSPAPMPVRPPITYAHTQAGVRHKDRRSEEEGTGGCVDCGREDMHGRERETYVNNANTLLDLVPGKQDLGQVV